MPIHDAPDEEWTQASWMPQGAQEQLSQLWTPSSAPSTTTPAVYTSAAMLDQLVADVAGGQ